MIRVLVVDDNDTLREALADALDDRGLEVVGQATNGRAACDAALVLQPDVVVMDIRMPDMPGPDATAWLASRCPAVRVIGLTAYDDEALHHAMERAGAASVLVKGTSIKQIVGAIAGAVAVPE
ncbi:MAG TPA: response regulator transcription factor [Actinomycetes bacterium]|nr:response regulator transcription factor [Actinomycetes bacterium]